MIKKIMFSMVIMLVFFFLFCLWLMWQFYLLFFYIRECASPFECGFDPKDNSRLPFSLRFFSMLILFLIFDVELVLILHLPMFNASIVKGYLLYMMFILFLLMGLLEEWRRSFLDWKIW